MSYGMKLQGQGLSYRQDLREVRQLRVTELLDYILANEIVRVLVEHVLKVFASLEHF